MSRRRRRHRLRRGAGGLLAVLAALAPSAAAPSGSATATVAVPGFCEPDTSVTTYRWDGGAGTDQWIDDANWVGDHAPGFSVADGPVRVCLNSGDTVVLVHNDNTPSGQAVLEALDLAADARLTVAVGGGLYVEGDPTQMLSFVRGGAELRLSGELGGVGTVQVNGWLRWIRKPASASTMTTRRCQVGRTCSPTDPLPGPGRTVIGADGRLTIEGAQGVALIDRRVIEDRGTISIGDGVFLAADNGTRIVVQEGGSLVLDGSADIYQGWADLPDLPVVEMAGTTVKTGSGSSMVATHVMVRSTARARVKAGKLSLGSDRAPIGAVRPGTTYRLGRCPNGDNVACPVPVATSWDLQTESVTIPRTSTRAATVRLRELPGQQVAGDLGPPVRVHVRGASPTVAHPLVFTIRVDGAAPGMPTPAATLRVLRRADGAGSYAIIPSCLNGAPPAGAKACVARRHSFADGDVGVVVRTQVTSRWKIR